MDWSVGHERRDDREIIFQEQERRSVREELRPELTVNSKAARLLKTGGGSRKGKGRSATRSARSGGDSQGFDAEDFV